MQLTPRKLAVGCIQNLSGTEESIGGKDQAMCNSSNYHPCNITAMPDMLEIVSDSQVEVDSCSSTSKKTALFHKFLLLSWKRMAEPERVLINYVYSVSDLHLKNLVASSAFTCTCPYTFKHYPCFSTAADQVKVIVCVYT